MEENRTQWLTGILPPVERVRTRNEPDLYGASYLIASKVGRTRPPRSYAFWSHGWVSRPVTHPRQLARGPKRTRHLVATEEHAEALRDFGFRKAVATGLPFAYVDDGPVERIPGSLLVMPAHSLPYTCHNWQADRYAEAISRLKPHFATVVACQHSSCVAKSYWTGEFEKRGIPWIVGADVEDTNALLRISRLLRSFEYVTTNSVGSHVPYAAYSGCKVSVYGPYASPCAGEYRHDPWFARYPEVLKENIEFAQEHRVRERFPDLFVFPSEAVTRTAWGEEMIGAAFRRSPEEIASLLGWSVIRQLAERGKSYMRRLSPLFADPLVGMGKTIRRTARLFGRRA